MCYCIPNENGFRSGRALYSVHEHEILAKLNPPKEIKVKTDSGRTSRVIVFEELYIVKERNTLIVKLTK